MLFSRKVLYKPSPTPVKRAFAHSPHKPHFSRVRGTGGAALQLVEGHEKLSNSNYCLTRTVCVTLVRPIKRTLTHQSHSSSRHRRCCPTVSRGPRKIIKQQLLSHTYSVCDTGSSDQTDTHTFTSLECEAPEVLPNNQSSATKNYKTAVIVSHVLCV